MSNHRSDPTANAAIGAVGKELKMLQKRAKRLSALHRRGLLSPAELAEARRQFTGIYRRLLPDALK